MARSAIALSSITNRRAVIEARQMLAHHKQTVAEMQREIAHTSDPFLRRMREEELQRMERRFRA